MAIINNRTTAAGDVLIITPEIPIVGLLSLSQFVDTTVAESSTDYYFKEFRTSTNGGITFTVWLELTNINISAVVVGKFNQFVIEYRYTHVGTTSTVELEFDDILVSGEIEDLPYPIYNTTYFKDFFEVNDISVYTWALNVLEKLYLKGILPEYIVRGEGNNNLEDEDFIVFWNSITHYFAIIVYFARQFKDITQNTTLVEDFLTNRGLEINNTEVEDLVFIFSNWVLEYSKRGSLQIIDKKSDDKDVDGELFRLIGYDSLDEFILAHLMAKDVGWCVGVSSPIWNGTENMINLIKGFEYTKEVLDLAKYPLLNSSKITLVDDKIHIAQLLTTETAGIQNIDGGKKIVVSPDLSYEISFFVKVSNVNTPISFSLKGYDSAGNDVGFDSIKTGVTSNDFFVREELKFAGTVYFIRGILYNQGTAVDSDNFVYPNGNNLRSKLNVNYIVPEILLDNSVSGSTSGTMDIWNLKIRPLKTNFTRGQLGIKNIILLYLINRNPKYDVDILEGIIASKLLNAGSFLKTKQIGKNNISFNLFSSNLLYLYYNYEGRSLTFYDITNTTLIKEITVFTGNKIIIDISVYSELVAGTYTLNLYKTNGELYKTFEDKMIIV